MSAGELAATIVGILVAGVIVLVVLARERRSARIRFGIFVERELDHDDDEPKRD